MSWKRKQEGLASAIHNPYRTVELLSLLKRKIITKKRGDVISPTYWNLKTFANYTPRLYSKGLCTELYHERIRNCMASPNRFHSEALRINMNKCDLHDVHTTTLVPSMVKFHLFLVITNQTPISQVTFLSAIPTQAVLTQSDYSKAPQTHLKIQMDNPLEPFYQILLCSTRCPQQTLLDRMCLSLKHDTAS